MTRYGSRRSDCYVANVDANCRAGKERLLSCPATKRNHQMGWAGAHLEGFLYFEFFL